MNGLICNNRNCKYLNKDKKRNNCLFNCPTITNKGCISFKKDVLYYTDLGWKVLNKNSNMITSFDIADKDTKIGLYFLMKLFNVAFSNSSYGDWTWFSVIDPDTNKNLTSEEIANRPINEEFLVEIFNTFREDKEEEYIDNLINRHNSNKSKESETKNEIKEPVFGWLSPSGDFFVGEFGTHEKIAHEIIKNKFEDEFKESNYFPHAGDFLVQEKKYVLIDRPSGPLGAIQVSYNEYFDYTSEQKKFLFDYFMNIGDKNRAYNYV